MVNRDVTLSNKFTLSVFIYRVILPSNDFSFFAKKIAKRKLQRNFAETTDRLGAICKNRGPVSCIQRTGPALVHCIQFLFAIVSPIYMV